MTYEVEIPAFYLVEQESSVKFLCSGSGKVQYTGTDMKVKWPRSKWLP